MDSLVDDMQRVNARAWQTRIALVNSSGIPTAAKAAAMSVIKDKQDKAGSLQRRLNELEKENIHAMASILDFFDQHRSAISANDRTIVFARPDLLAEYNHRTSAIKRVLDEQKSLEEKYAGLVGDTRHRSTAVID